MLKNDGGWSSCGREVGALHCAYKALTRSARLQGGSVATKTTRRGWPVVSGHDRDEVTNALIKGVASSSKTTTKTAERVLAALVADAEMIAGEDGKLWVAIDVDSDDSDVAAAWAHLCAALAARESVQTDHQSGLSEAAQEAIRFVERVGELSDADAAKLLDAKTATVRSWRTGAREPGESATRRIFAMHDLFERIATIVQPERIPVWVRRPIPALDRRSVLDALEAGALRDVDAFVADLESPGAI